MSMKTYLSSLVPAMAVSVLLGASAIAASAPIITNTDHPTLAPIEANIDNTQPSEASPTGAVKNMAPVRGKPLTNELAEPAESASGLTLPGASSGSSLGSGSNSTLTSKPEQTQEQLDVFED